MIVATLHNLQQQIQELCEINIQLQLDWFQVLIIVYRTCNIKFKSFTKSMGIIMRLQTPFHFHNNIKKNLKSIFPSSSME
jgi:hypothetical protein